MIEKLFKEVFIMKKFLRGILYWGFEVIMLPISLINLLFVYPILGIKYVVSGEVDSFKEFLVTLKDVISNMFKAKNLYIKYGFIEGRRKCEEYIENEE